MSCLKKSANILKWQVIIGIGLLVMGYCPSVVLANPDYVMKQFESFPVNIIENAVKPQVQINASNDQQLYYKAYNDYSDLDDDQIPEMTYKHSIDYYGYFDNKKCYNYVSANKRFEPVSITSDKYCNAGGISDQWSGNFLNWASMTRIDAIRKILFGGHRRVDTKTETVLERAFVPPDIHAFAKYYNRVDLTKLTPFQGLPYSATTKTSTTTLSVGKGTQTLVVADPELWISKGDHLIIKEAGGSAMEGNVIGVDDVTEKVTINVTDITGAGTLSTWDVTNDTIRPTIMQSATWHTNDTWDKDYFFTTDPSALFVVGDYVAVSSRSNPLRIFQKGWIKSIDVAAKKIIVTVKETSDAVQYNSWTITNYRPTPNTTFANTTQINIGTGKKKFVFADDPSNNFKVDDSVRLDLNPVDTTRYMTGKVIDVNAANKSILVDVTYSEEQNGFQDWDIANLTRTGVTLCNVTYSATNTFSENITDPPLIRVAYGNYAFWAAGEKSNCIWRDEPNSYGSNYNSPQYSEIPAPQQLPYKEQGAGEKDYVARVLVNCKDWNGDTKIDSKDNSDNCKLYPNGNYKPIGLLQEYGDNDQLLFGMIAGTYNKARHGGDMIMPLFFKDNGANNMCREINLGRDCNGDGTVDDLIDSNHAKGDGTFKLVWQGVGGPITNKQQSGGVINTWSIYRIKGYQYQVWDYTSNSGDKCPLSINFFGDASTSECQNWGNPFAEIYLTALRHWVGKNAPTDYQSPDNDKGVFGGMNYLNGVWEDPLKKNYCAPLSIINFNSSVISSDTAFDKKDDELDSANQGIKKDLDSPYFSYELTKQIGVAEGISDSGKKWFVGETTSDGSKTCTAKAVPDLGQVRGLCPEGPGLQGGYRIAGMAWYAHTNDIRPSTLTGGLALQGTQSVDNYSVRLASGNPLMKIPVPGSTDQYVTLIPSCINNNKNNYGCSLVDFKIIEPHYLDTSGTVPTGRGKFMAIWEDSLQGNDYDLDAGGIYEYEITGNQIKVTTAVTLQALGHAIGHGYIISGTSKDGLHIHSGTNGFVYSDPTGVQGCPTTSKCYMGSSSLVTYDLLDTSSGGSLEDPLWYAAKWGGFDDTNGNKVPDLTEEWDKKINKTGKEGSDGIPDNYFFASHPQQLENSLRATFDAILERTSSGTAAAVVSSNVRGEGALFQAFYEPLKKQDGKEANWIGTLQALWLDSYGRTRQDCSPTDTDFNIDKNDVANPDDDTCKASITPANCTPNGVLDNYCVDQVVATYFDEFEQRTRARVYNSNSPEEFEALSMQGVVTAYSNGAVTMVPNSLQGAASYSSGQITLSPLYIEGTVDTYDPVTGLVAITVTGQVGPSGQSFASWDVVDSTSNISGNSSDSITFGGGSTLSFHVEPVGSWITAGDTVRLTTMMPVGRLGETFNDWDVECLSGATATGVIRNIDIEISNSGSHTFVVEDPVGDFSTCTRAKISSYGMEGDAGVSHAEWEVANLDVLLGRGGSTSSLTLSNSGNKSFNVTPTSNWMSVGDRVMVSNNSYSIVELYDIGYLWNAREELYLESLPVNVLQTNRVYGTNLSSGTMSSLGRYITTWVDSNLNGDVDPGEYRDFQASMFSGAGAAKYSFFDVDTLAEAEEVVNYVRGIEFSDTRNRTIKYAAGDPTEHVMRLGDIINSTPTVVGSPQEAFNILYKDTSYTAFREQYQDRRVMIYAGGNDGLFHAFNGGFYNVTDVKTVEYSKSGSNLATGSPAVEHPLGGEMWAYAPYNLLSHLQWLKDPDYAQSHVYFMDAKPRVFDAQIFEDDENHPNGWGTVLVAGMNLGGGPMEVDTNSDDDASTADNRILRSAYIIFDITNPEEPPVLLGEIPMPDNSFTTVYPAVLAFKDVLTGSNGIKCSDDGSNCVSKWYLQFGTGPNNMGSYTSSQTAKMYLFDLSQLTSSTASPKPASTDIVVDSNVANGQCKMASLTPRTNIVACDTKVPATFMGTPVVVDWDLDFYADTSYFGLVGDANANTGRVMRFSLENNDDTDAWLPMITFFQSDLPVVGQPTPAIDDNDRKWVFFGTGRHFVIADKTSVTLQSLFGVLDDETGVTVLPADLLNVTNVEVYTDRSLNAPLATVAGDPFGTQTPMTTFDEIEDYMDGEDDATADGPMGWRLELPPILGTATVDPATRNTTRSALIGGVLFSSVFQPSLDPCKGEGQSRLYGLYYKTGTAYPGPTIFGSIAENVSGELKYRALKYVDLGGGVATSPAIHSGAGTGSDEVSAFTQLSTGDIVRQQVKTVLPVRTGKTSWSDR